VVTHAECVLFGRRAVAGGGFEWQLPGGWIEPGEAPRQAARREVREETGLELKDLHYVGITSNVFSPNSHSISLYFEAECLASDALSVAAAEACNDWTWRQWAEVTENLFLPLRLFRETGFRPFNNHGREAGTWI
jgi:8-oxo-dGTP diphosphatase